jgi:hypothetical protein
MPEQATLAVNATTDQIAVNRQIPDAKFDMSLPPGTELFELLDGKRRRYVVK